VKKTLEQQRKFFGFIYLNKLIERIVADDRSFFYIKHEHRNIYIMNGIWQNAEVEKNIIFVVILFLIISYSYSSSSFFSNVYCISFIRFNADPDLNHSIWLELKVWLRTISSLLPSACFKVTVNGTPGANVSKPLIEILSLG